MNSLEPKASSNVRKHFALAFSALATMLIVSESYAHIRITPVGRMGTLDRAKFIQNNKANPVVPDSPGPCAANTTRMATPLQVQGGSMFTFMVQETINHPGRFYVQFSNGGDAGFWQSQNQLALVEDPLNNATTPVAFRVPNINCNTCTFRVLQEMDEQPGEFYVHCVDVNITASTGPGVTPDPTPSGPGTEGSLSANKEFTKPGFGGCGLVASTLGAGPKDGGPRGPSAVLTTLLGFCLMLPLMLAMNLRRRRASVRT